MIVEESDDHRKESTKPIGLKLRSRGARRLTAEILGEGAGESVERFCQAVSDLKSEAKVSRLLHGERSVLATPRVAYEKDHDGRGYSEGHGRLDTTL